VQLDALTGNNISVISHFTFSQSASEPHFRSNLLLFPVSRKRKDEKKTNNNVSDCITGCIRL